MQATEPEISILASSGLVAQWLELVIQSSRVESVRVIS